MRPSSAALDQDLNYLEDRIKAAEGQNEATDTALMTLYDSTNQNFKMVDQWQNEQGRINDADTAMLSSHQKLLNNLDARLKVLEGGSTPPPVEPPPVTERTLRALFARKGLSVGCRVPNGNTSAEIDRIQWELQRKHFSDWIHLMLFTGINAPSGAYEEALKYDAGSTYHCLNYPAPNDWNVIETRMKGVSAALAGDRGTMQVINECAGWWNQRPYYNKYPYYNHDFMIRLFEMARKYFPDMKLAISEANCEGTSLAYSSKGGLGQWVNAAGHRDAFFIVVENLAKRRLVDVVHFQMHGGPGNEPGGRWQWDLNGLLEFCMSQNLRVAFTEHDWCGGLDTHSAWLDLMIQSIEVCEVYKQIIDYVGFWGSTKAGNWLLNPANVDFYRPTHSPCLFGDDGIPLTVCNKLMDWLAA